MDAGKIAVIIFFTIGALGLFFFIIEGTMIIVEEIYEKQSKKRANINRLEYGLNNVCSRNKPINFVIDSGKTIGPFGNWDDCWNLPGDESTGTVECETIVDRKHSRISWCDGRTGKGRTFAIR